MGQNIKHLLFFYLPMAKVPYTVLLLTPLILISLILPVSVDAVVKKYLKKVPVALAGPTPLVEIVSGLYVFGDSTTDAGNNVYIYDSISADFPPYGIDFGSGNQPTGRFCNGRTVPDMLAYYLGLPPPPAYNAMSAGAKKSTMDGVNYGSSGCGILPDTRPPEKKCLSLAQQIQMFNSTVHDDLLYNPVFTRGGDLSSYLAHTLIYISTGANDYFFSYPNSDLSSELFAKDLILELGCSIRTLYEIGARRFLVNDIAPIGCIPQKRNSSGLCDEDLNQLTAEFIGQLSDLIAVLNHNYPDGSFFLGASRSLVYNILANPGQYGFTNVTGACCGEYTPEGQLDCKPGATPCNNRNEYLFFDGAHTTEAANKLFALLCTNRTQCS